MRILVHWAILFAPPFPKSPSWYLTIPTIVLAIIRFLAIASLAGEGLQLVA